MYSTIAILAVIIAICTVNYWMPEEKIVCTKTGKPCPYADDCECGMCDKPVACANCDNFTNCEVTQP